MAQTIHPAIKKLAHKHRLGTPEQLYTHVVAIRLLFGLLAVFALLAIFFNLTLLTNTGNLRDPAYKDPVGFEVLLLFLIAIIIWGIVYTYLLPYYCRCTEGFLELKRGDSPKLIRAMHWDDVTSTRRKSIGRGQSKLAI